MTYLHVMFLFLQGGAKEIKLLEEWIEGKWGNIWLTVTGLSWVASTFSVPWSLSCDTHLSVCNKCAFVHASTHYSRWYFKEKMVHVMSTKKKQKRWKEWRNGSNTIKIQCKKRKVIKEREVNDGKEGIKKNEMTLNSDLRRNFSHISLTFSFFSLTKITHRHIHITLWPLSAFPIAFLIFLSYIVQVWTVCANKETGKELEEIFLSFHTIFHSCLVVERKGNQNQVRVKMETKLVRRNETRSMKRNVEEWMKNDWAEDGET